MIVYNLTDRTPPWERVPRTPQPVKLFGKMIPAGGFMEFSNFPLRAVTGLINSHTISVDTIPDWYQKIGDDQRHRESVKIISLKDTVEEKPKKRRRRADD